MKYIKYIIYRLFWHIAPYFPTGKFIHLDIEINNNCNQRCVFCWHSEKKLKFEIASMPSDRVYNYLDQAWSIGVKSVKFNFRGEPLLNKNILEYVRYASKLGFIDIMINTNGVLLSSKTLFDLDEAGLTKCIISIDSMNQHIYTRLHKCNKVQFERLIINLFNIKKLKEENKIKCQVICNFHINELNEDEDFKDYAKDLAPLKTVVRHTQNRHGKHISIFKPGKRRKHCPHMKRRLVILANERIYPCCQCYDEPVDIELFPINKNLQAVWKSYKRQYMILNYKKRNYVPSCENCKSGDIYV